MKPPKVPQIVDFKIHRFKSFFSPSAEDVYHPCNISQEALETLNVLPRIPRTEWPQNILKKNTKKINNFQFLLEQHWKKTTFTITS